MKSYVEKYIEFAEIPNPGKKTRIWAVNNKRHGLDVGQIKWWGAFRKYCFFPGDNMLYDPACLRMIADFTELQTRQHSTRI